MRVAILGKIFVTWGGGLDLLRVITSSLSIGDKRPIKIFLFVPRNDIYWISELKLLLKKGMCTFLKKLKQRRDIINFFDCDIKIIFYRDSTSSEQAVCDSLNDLLEKYKIDVVLSMNASLGKDFHLPWIGYVTDMQYRHYPNNYTLECYQKGLEKHDKIMSDAKAICVSSNMVERDVLNFYPATQTKIFVLPFAPIPRCEWIFNDNSIFVKKKYALPEKYFLVSNYFNIHDSHITAFEALAHMHNNGFSDVYLICTGGIENTNTPNYFSELMDSVDRLGIRDKIYILGFIPKNDQIAIMKNALAVVQPTLYEGGPGGGSVYDAVSLGVPAIVSDIAVNREIKNKEQVIFFKATQSYDLFEKMKGILLNPYQKLNTNHLLNNRLITCQKMKSIFLEAFNFVRNNS